MNISRKIQIILLIAMYAKTSQTGKKYRCRLFNWPIRKLIIEELENFSVIDLHV